MIIGPLAKLPVIQDLVVDRRFLMDLMREYRLFITGWQPTEGFICLQVKEAWERLTRCRECLACLSACPYWESLQGKYGGPYLFVKLALLLLDPRDRVDRREQAVALGIERCRDCGRCYCPCGIPIYRDAIGVLLSSSNQLGQAEIKRVGDDVTVVATSQMVQRSLKAASRLADEGTNVEVIDPRTLPPLDTETIISSVKKTGRLVVVHEAVTRCGMGAEIASMVVEQAFEHLDAPVKRVGAPFCPPPFSKPMENYYLPAEDAIIAAVKEIV